MFHDRIDIAQTYDYLLEGNVCEKYMGKGRFGWKKCGGENQRDRTCQLSPWLWGLGSHNTFIPLGLGPAPFCLFLSPQGDIDSGKIYKVMIADIVQQSEENSS